MTHPVLVITGRLMKRGSGGELCGFARSLDVCWDRSNIPESPHTPPTTKPSQTQVKRMFILLYLLLLLTLGPFFMFSERGR